MARLNRHLAAHPRLLATLLVGIAAALSAPAAWRPVTRGLLGWNVGVWSYLLVVALTMWRADRGHLQRTAARQAESALAVLLVVTTAAVVSLGAIVFELAAVKGATGGQAWPHLAFAASTVIGSWLLVPTLFALSYASVYYGMPPGRGLAFPHEEATFEPDYVDFLYYAFTIAVAAQTADVAASTRAMRRLTLAQSVLAFAFNTAVLALSINIAAGLF